VKHRFFVASEQVQGDAVNFTDDQAHQIRNVLRLRAGDTVRVFDGTAAVDRVVELIPPASGRVVDAVAQAPEPTIRVVAYPALLQRDKFESVLQKLTELGVGAVVPVLTARSLVREPPDEHRLARWRSILREAAEQSGRGIVPELVAALPFSAAIARAVAEGTVLMACESEHERTLREGLRGAQRTVSVFVGPEGGYTPEEAAAAEQLGVQLITLGPRILRTETASPVLAALVLYELEAQAVTVYPTSVPDQG
jgi:16S rRNA (uracil1498-N3)-methyltransferase